jgi:hypothetical protein
MRFPDEFNFHTKEWATLDTLLREDLKSAVDQLCNTSCTPAQTDQLRGRIGYIKDLLGSAAAAVKERQR